MIYTYPHTVCLRSVRIHGPGLRRHVSELYIVIPNDGMVKT